MTTETTKIANAIAQLNDHQKEALTELVDALGKSGDTEAVEAFKDDLVGASREERQASKQAAYDEMSVEEQKEAFLLTPNQRRKAREREERLSPE